jgi:hypothetical protein
MREYPGWTNRMPAVIAGAVIAGFAAFGVGTLVRAVPVSDANVPAGSAANGTGIVRTGAAGPAASVATIPAANPRASRAWCPECGIVESIVELAPYADIGEQGMVPVNADDDATGSAKDRAHVAPARHFAMTVRFRDGTRMVFHEATARNWHPGVRVIVIAGVTAPTP